MRTSAQEANIYTRVNAKCWGNIFITHVYIKIL